MILHQYSASYQESDHLVFQACLRDGMDGRAVILVAPLLRAGSEMVWPLGVEKQTQHSIAIECLVMARRSPDRHPVSMSKPPRVEHMTNTDSDRHSSM